MNTMVRWISLLTLFICYGVNTVAGQSCPNPYTAPQIADLTLCVFEDSTNPMDLADSSSAQNDNYEFFRLTSALPTGVSFDEASGLFTYNPPSGSGLYQSFTMQACQVIDPACLTYTDTCSGQTSGMTFIYVGSGGQDVYIFESGECLATGTPLACGENLQYGDVLVWPEGPAVSNIDIWIGNNAGGCSSFSCSNPTIVQHVSCATLLTEVMGKILGGAILAYDAVGDNTSGNKRKPVENAAGYAYEYCSAEVTVSLDIKGTATIGDQIFLDLDGNNSYNSADLPLANVEITLTDINGNTRTTTTNSLGQYSFDQLPAGDYTVSVNTSTLPVGINNTFDPDGGTSNQASVNLSVGEEESTIDFGYQGSSSIGDQLFVDVDGNGSYSSAKDFPIDGVTITLIDANGNSVTTSTNSTGQYLFDNLPSGNYQVLVSSADLPTGVANTVDPDSDGNTNEANVSLQLNQDLRTVDFGYQGNASVGDQLYLDLNDNKIYDLGSDLPLENIGVTLEDANGNTISTQTDQNGNYLFDNLPAGNYTILVDTQDLPAGVTNTADPDGGAPNQTSVSITTNQNDLTRDFGYRGDVTIGDKVFLDANSNGIDDGEAGVDNVTVTLFDASGNQVGESITTQNGGNYLFSGLIAGSYYVVFSDLPAAHQFTAQNTGANDEVDSDADPSTGQSHVTSLIVGESDHTLDAGIYALGSVTSYVWHDLNGNGIQDNGEPAIEGATVKLSGSGTIISRTTGSNGEYTFTDLPPGDYTVEFVLPAGYDSRSPQDQGNDDTKDSDANVGNGVTSSFTLPSGQNISNIDAGFYQTASLGNLIWEDKNANGVQDNGELGLPALQVNLLDGSGNPTGLSTFTNLDGTYNFDNLEPGDYMIEVVYPSGLFISPQNQGSDDADSDINPSTGRSGVYALVSGENDHTVDGGLYRLASIGDYAWIDANANGIQDEGEDPASGLTATLFDGSGNQVGIPTTTAQDGSYSFVDLVPGDYYVQFSNLPDGAEFSTPGAGSDASKDSDVNPATMRTPTTSLSSGENDGRWDAGIFSRVSLGDNIWIDTNGDGIKDATDTGHENVLVVLKDLNGTQISQVYTDTNGDYLFSGLLPGNYTVEIHSSNFEVGGALYDMYNSYDKDGNYDMATSETLNSGADMMDLDFGFASNLLLPVELISFNAQGMNTSVELTWQTASEIDNDHFIIERSADGSAFEGIGQEVGAGTSISLRSYQFIDLEPLLGRNYYRLKQVDLDGSVNYSDVQVVVFNHENNISVYPTLVDTDVRIEMPSFDVQGQPSILLVDNTGQILISSIMQSRRTDLELGQLPAGMYFIVIDQGKEHTVRRIIKR